LARGQGLNEYTHANMQAVFVYVPESTLKKQWTAIVFSPLSPPRGVKTARCRLYVCEMGEIYIYATLELIIEIMNYAASAALSTPANLNINLTHKYI